MRPSTYAGIALLAACGAAFAQQPLTVPGRSQSAWQQSVDNAACYGYANQTTKVNMAREPQTQPRDAQAQRDARTLTPPRPVEPPLPPGASGASAASAAHAASGAVPASGTVAASGASATMASGALPHPASGTIPAMPAVPASMAAGASGASDAIYGGDMKMPPLPPPEPPMTRYWRAYSECMQNRGYFTR
ncbi:hypothetical protein AWB77_05062 [Caballeronia fortuita]|uniref:Lipoprotein n=1 Tax=Caballeronia fortuita TaxID=1777138 RepID=A0A158D8P7_9BURK|nr:hypothetical protein [Caballeronia fortuita]SAK91054.1 hypothetical protein AWB77_05062 [Caballeronia fortuita]